MDDVRNAEQAYQDALLEKKKYEISSEIERLEEERNKLLEGYDDEIERLNKISEKWSEVVDKISQAQNELKADELFGEGWKDKVLSGNDDDLYDMFQKLYESASNEQSKVDEQIASNERIVAMMQRFVELYQDGSITYEKAMEGINQLANQMKDGYSAMEQLSGLMSIDGIEKVTDISASTNAKIEESVNLLGDYMAIAKSNNETLEQYTSTWTEMKEDIAAQLEEIEKLAKELEEYIKSHKYKGNNYYYYDDGDDSYYWSDGVTSNGVIESGMNGGTYHDGRSDSSSSHTPSSDSYSSDHERNDAFDMLDDDDEFHVGIEKGLVGKATRSRTEFLQEIATKDMKPGERYIKVLDGEAVFTEAQQKQMAKNFDLATTANLVPVIDAPSLSPFGSSSSNNVSITLGNIVLQDVQQPDQLAQALDSQFANLMRQRVSKWNR